MVAKSRKTVGMVSSLVMALVLLFLPISAKGGGGLNWLTDRGLRTVAYIDPNHMLDENGQLIWEEIPCCIAVLESACNMMDEDDRC